MIYFCSKNIYWLVQEIRRINIKDIIISKIISTVPQNQSNRNVILWIYAVYLFWNLKTVKMYFVWKFYKGKLYVFLSETSLRRVQRQKSVTKLCSRHEIVDGTNQMWKKNIFFSKCSLYPNSILLLNILCILLLLLFYVIDIISNTTTKDYGEVSSMRACILLQCIFYI